jgi:zinc transporter ZupT
MVQGIHLQLVAAPCIAYVILKLSKHSIDIALHTYLVVVGGGLVVLVNQNILVEHLPQELSSQANSHRLN